MEAIWKRYLNQNPTKNVIFGRLSACADAECVPRNRRCGAHHYWILSNPSTLPHMSFVNRTHFNFHIFKWYTGDLVGMDNSNQSSKPFYYYRIISSNVILFTSHLSCFQIDDRLSSHQHHQSIFMSCTFSFAHRGFLYKNPNVYFHHSFTFIIDLVDVELLGQ